MLASNCCGSQRQSAVQALDPIGEVQPLVVDLDAEMHGPAGGNGDRRGESVGLGRVGRARHHAEMLAERFVVRKMEIMELRAVVVADEPRSLLEMLRLEFDDRGRAETMRLLTPGDERLRERAAERFAAKETQAARPRREAEDLLRPRRPQPLEVDRQLRRVEILARGGAGNSRAGKDGAGVSSVGTPCPSKVRSQPSRPQTIF